jgi:hypothetical protein
MTSNTSCLFRIDLPVLGQPDLAISDIMGSAIAKVLPYCPFSKTLEPPVPWLESPLPQTESDNDHNTAAMLAPSNPLIPSLEYCLLGGGMFQTPLIDPEFNPGTAINEAWINPP